MLTPDDIYAIEQAITALENYEGYFTATASSGANGLQKILDRHRESEPQPIETAPRDGTIILTDVGVCQPSRNGWTACTVDGWDLCNSSEQNASKQNPTLWQPLPDWMKK